jgi:hypothetical protein
MKYTHYERQKRWLAKNPDYVKKWKDENPDYHKTYLNEWTKTFKGHASQLYSYIKRRLRTAKEYVGLKAVSREVFTSWCLNDDNYRRLYALWVRSNFDPNLSPSTNRKDTSKGYTLDNIEIVTTYDNRVDGCKTMNRNRWRTK